jgi:hypothetical protein
LCNLYNDSEISQQGIPNETDQRKKQANSRSSSRYAKAR